MIALENISVSLATVGKKRRQILEDISLEIPSGDWLVVVGPNGSGKTTLLELIAGLIPSSSGTLTKSGGARGGDIDFMLFFQDPDNQFVSGSVWSELLLGLSTEELKSFHDYEPSGLKDKVAVKLEEAIEGFNLRGFLDRSPHNLSGGEKQRLVMACAHLADPDILLLDEPTSFLDARGKRECMGFVKKMNEKGKTVIWASTGGDEILTAKRGIYLEDGQIKFIGAGEDLVDFLGKNTSLFLPRVFQAARKLIDVIREDSSRKGEDSSRIDRRGYKDEIAPSIAPTNALAMKASDVSFSYGVKKKALRNVNLEVLSGELAALTGPNGSGKTTLLEIIGGMKEPSSGRVVINTDRVAISTIEDNNPRRHGGIIYLIQSPERMFFAETVLAEIAFGLKALKYSSSEIFSMASHALSHVGLHLDLLESHSPFHLSMGEMRRLAFAIAISLKPNLLLMDEPTACLDREGERALRALLARAKNDHITVVMASHDVDFAASVCDKLIFLEEGEVKDILPIENHRIGSADLWPSEEKPYVLELQEALAPLVYGSGGLVLSMDSFVRSLFNDSEAHVP